MIDDLRENAHVIIGLLFIFALGRGCEQSHVKACLERHQGNLERCIH